jgi:membrane-associated phospholipid phosphatase
VHTLGNTLGTTVVGLAMAAYWLVRRQRGLAMFLLVSAVSVRVVVNLMKYLVGRPRPPEQLAHVVGNSFPSGHVSSATILAAVFAIVLVHRGARWQAVALTAATALLMAWDRTYLSVHWLSDTVASTAVAVGVPLALWPLFATRVVADLRARAAQSATPTPHR